MAGFLYTLRADSETIRDTTVNGTNTPDFVGKWCVDCCRYIGATSGAVVTEANRIRGEGVTSANTAYRMGNWCNLVLSYVGERSGKINDFNDLRMRANIIQSEYRDQANVRRLGAWFYDFLVYIDYAGEDAGDYNNDFNNDFKIN